MPRPHKQKQELPPPLLLRLPPRQVQKRLRRVQPVPAWQGRAAVQGMQSRTQPAGEGKDACGGKEQVAGRDT